MTQYLYDGLNPVEEMDGASPPSPTATMLTGLGIDEYFQRTDSSGTLSYLTDILGSTVALADSSGALDTTYSYEPFGNTTVSGSSGNPYQFTGRENDGAGLYYYRARYYSPRLQRFVSQDPIGFRAGDGNLYAYVLNSPTNFVDRSGRQAVPPYANPGSPEYNPRLTQFLNDLENNPRPLLPADPNTPIPPGEPGLWCAVPPSQPPPTCPQGEIPTDWMAFPDSGAVLGAGAGGFLGGPYGAVGGAIIGFGSGLWVWYQHLGCQ